MCSIAVLLAVPGLKAEPADLHPGGFVPQFAGFNLGETEGGNLLTGARQVLNYPIPEHS